jgi:hypothetical protein
MRHARGGKRIHCVGRRAWRARVAFARRRTIDLGLRGVRAKGFADPGVHSWLSGQLTRASRLAVKATAFPPQQFVELLSILTRAKVYGITPKPDRSIRHVRQPGWHQPANAVIAKTRLSAMCRGPEIPPLPKSGMPLARENLQSPLWPTRHRMRPRSLIQVWMSSAI